MGIFARVVIGFGIFAAAVAHSLAERKTRANPDVKPGTRSMDDLLRQTRAQRRKPPEAGLAVPAIPPSGPLPMQGGAAAPLDFEA